MLHTVLSWMDDVFDRLGKSRLRDAPLALVLLAPGLTVLGVFGLFPIFFAVHLSLFDFRSGPGPFAGWANYVSLVHDPAFWNSVQVTLYYVLGTVPLSLGLSFAVAGALFRVGRGRGVLRTVFFLPYVTSIVAAAMVWRTLLNPSMGVVNVLCEAVGLPAQQWLLEPRGVLHLISGGAVAPTAGPSLALCCIIAFEIWHCVGFMAVVLLAGMSVIPRELYDAVRIDGAGVWRTARHVTLPLLSPTAFFLAVVSVIRAFQAFSSFYALTGDGRGPLDTTQNLTVFVFTSFYENGQWSYGAAAAVLMFLGIVVLTLVQWRVAGRKVFYG